MRRTLIFATVGLVLSIAPAHAESSYRIDHVTGVNAWFSVGSLEDGTQLSASVQFRRSESIAASGEEEAASDLGLCVTVFSHHERLEPSQVYSSRWTERGCVEIAPASEAPLRLTATIPTVIRITDGVVPEVIEERPSSVTLDLTWTPMTPSTGRMFVCSPSGGPTSMRGTPIRVDTMLGGTASHADVVGSISSAEQGALFQPRAQACFTEAYYVAATLDPAP